MNQRVDVKTIELPLILANIAGEINDVIVKPFEQEDESRVLTNNSAQPVSPFDGKIMKAIETAKEIEFPASNINDMLVLATCPACKVELRASAEVCAALSEQSFFCIACSEPVVGNKIAPTQVIAQLKIESSAGQDDAKEEEEEEDSSAADEDERDEDDEDDADKKETATMKEKPTTASEVDPTKSADTSITATDPKIEPPAAEIKPEDKPTDPVVASEETPAAEPAKVETPVAEIKPEDKPTDPVVASEETPAVIEEPKTTDAPVVEEPKTEAVQVALSSFVDWKKAQIHLVHAKLDSSSIYYVFANGKPVARLSEAKVDEQIKHLFNQVAFVDGFIAHANSEGLDAEHEKRFGLEPITTEITIDQHTKQELDSAKTALNDQVQAMLADAKAKSFQALATAVAGTIKGLWATENPLREGLIKTFAQLGHPNAEKVVDKQLEANAMDFFKSCMAKAQELEAAPDEGRDAVARMVATASYRTSSPSELSKTLAEVGVPVIELAGTQPVEVTAGIKESAVDAKSIQKILFPARR